MPGTANPPGISSARRPWPKAPLPRGQCVVRKPPASHPASALSTWSRERAQKNKNTALGQLATDGPGPVAATGVADLRRDGDLLLTGGLARQSGVLGAAVGVPRLLVELQAAVVAVAGVDG